MNLPAFFAYTSALHAVLSGSTILIPRGSPREDSKALAAVMSGRSSSQISLEKLTKSRSPTPDRLQKVATPEPPSRSASVAPTVQTTEGQKKASSQTINKANRPKASRRSPRLLKKPQARKPIARKPIVRKPIVKKSRTKNTPKPYRSIPDLDTVPIWGVTQRRTNVNNRPRDFRRMDYDPLTWGNTQQRTTPHRPGSAFRLYTRPKFKLILRPEQEKIRIASGTENDHTIDSSNLAATPGTPDTVSDKSHELQGHPAIPQVSTTAPLDPMLMFRPQPPPPLQLTQTFTGTSDGKPVERTTHGENLVDYARRITTGNSITKTVGKKGMTEY